MNYNDNEQVDAPSNEQERPASPQKEDANYRPQNQNPQVAYYKFQRAPEPGITFIFVVSIIALVIFSLRFITGLADLGDFSQLLNLANSSDSPEARDVVMMCYCFFGSFFALTGTGVAIIIMLVQSAKARNQLAINWDRLLYTSKLRRTILATLILSSIYLLMEFASYLFARNLISIPPEYQTQINVSLFTVIVFIALFITSYIYSRNFHKFLEKKQENSTTTPQQ